MASPTLTLITGANRGLGLESARQLGALGHHIIVAARTLASAEAAVAALAKEGYRSEPLVLDVTNAESIKAAVAQVEAHHHRLDVLVNNAGVTRMDDNDPTAVKLDALRGVWETNVFGLIAVTNAFLPLLKKSDAGRIVNLSSKLGSIAEHADPNNEHFKMRFVAYDTSKVAVNLYTVELALALASTNLKVNAAHPGWVKTDMGGANADLEVKDGVATTVYLATLPKDGPSGGFFHGRVHMRW